MRDNLSLLVTVYCFTQCLFANIYPSKINSKNNSLGITQSSQPVVIENSVPDFHVFDWKLCKALYETEKSNAVLSSISVKLVLLMLYEGALGDTAKQIERIVGFYEDKETIRKKFSKKLQSLQSYDTNDYVLDIGTKLFLDVTAKTKNEFNEILNTWYNSSFESVDFSKPLDAVKSINEWANNVTHGHIQELLTEDQTNENTALILLNAIYFQGFWTNPFIKDLTRLGTFYLNSKTTVEVPLMTTYNYFLTSSLPTLSARMICLPYVGDKFAMYIILPDSPDGLSDVVGKINPKILTNSIKSMKVMNTKVILPKFTFAYTSILGPVLQKLGITDMFGSKANLTNIGTGRLGSLVVSNVIQKAGLDINEQGSTAYAATEVELDTRFGTSVEAEFQVTKPFLFMIYDTKADTVIFVGQVVNPLSKGSPVVTIPIAKPTDNVNLKFGSEPNNVDFHRFNYFDSELFQEISSDESVGNFVISPISVKSVLLLLSEGAQGDTLKELNNVLRLPKEQSALHNLLQRNQLSMMSSYLDILSVNKIFIKNKKLLNHYFNDIATDLYKAEIVEINPSMIDESIRLINDQITATTKGLINSVITKDDFNVDTELLLANVLYFKGDWLYKFNETATDNQCFYTRPDLCTESSMMKLHSNIKYSDISDIGAQAIELPFKDENFTMFLLLPDENNNIVQLTKDLQHNPLSRLLTMLHSRVVHLQLPRFTINYYTKLSSNLKKMGLTTLFEKRANLTSIFNSEKPIFVTDIIQKAVIEINEKGAKAAAATVASAVPLSSKPHLPPVAVNFNRPFMFFIVNRSTKNILFSGQVNSITSDVSKRLQDSPPVHEKKSQTTQKDNNLSIQPLNIVKYQQPHLKNNQSVNYKH